MTDYILEYYQSITDGSIVVGKWIKLWYENIVSGLHEKRYTYNPKKANKAIRYIESFCRHHEGSMAPNLITLELWQKALLSVIFGILDDDGNRQFREVVIIMGRKNGKTLLAAAIASYMLYMDGEYGGRLFFCAPKLDQSKLCYEALYQMISKEPELANITKKRRTDLYVQMSNSSAQPLAFSAKKSDGLNPSLAVCDEIAAWSGDAGLKQYEVLKSALGARRQPLLLSISTANFVSDSIYDELVKRGTAVLQGSSKETRLCPFFYMIDDVDKWNDINELKKSNPNLGVSTTVDYLLEEIAVAEGSLSKKAEFITKYCNVKQNSSQAWLDTKTIKACCGKHFGPEDFFHTYGIGGIDLSMTTDLTACVEVIEKDGLLYVLAQFFLPRNKLEEAKARDGLPYDIYAKQGILTLSGENTVDYRDCFDWFQTLKKDHGIITSYIGYDRYSAAYLVQDLEAANYRCESVYQGENLTGVIIDTEGKFKDGLFRLGDNNLLIAHILDSALKINAETSRRKLVKVHRDHHIDGMAALLDAMCVRANHYDTLKNRLENRR